MNKNESYNIREKAKKKTEEQRRKKYLKKGSIIEIKEMNKVDSFLPEKTDFELKKGISNKTRIVTHDYTGMLEIDRGK